MKTNNNFLNNCPNAVDYETYLKGTGSKAFNEDFKLHLSDCELCKQSIQGYQTSGVTDISESLKSSSKAFKLNTNNSKSISLKIISYAASIIVLIGFSVFYFAQHNKLKSNSYNTNFDYTLLIENTSTKSKTLVKKTNNHFIYIGTCEKVAYNDQFLSSDELLKNLKNQKNINLITVEVATGNYDCAFEIINSLRLQNVAPIITISRPKGIKKLTPWGGGLGG